MQTRHRIGIPVSNDGPAMKDDQVSWVPLRKYWLHMHDDMPEAHEGVVFIPGKQPGHAGPFINLWTGWGVEPKQGGFPRLLEHLQDVVCDGDEASLHHLLKVLAYGVQNPNKPCPQAIAILGKQGGGKTTLSEAMTEIYGNEHTFEASDPELLVGSFTGHLERVIFIAAEEAFFVGNHSATRRLKHTLTSKRLTIHPKGLTPFFVPNLLRVIMTANDVHALDLDAEERRWFVLRASDHRVGDAAYFDALRDEMDNGGVAAFFHFLKGINLAGFSIHKKPHETEAKRDQQLSSLGDVAAFLQDALMRGEIVVKDPSKPYPILTEDQWSDPTNDHARFIPNHELMDAFRDFARRTGAFRRASVKSVTMELADLLKRKTSVRRKGPRGADGKQPVQRGFQLRTLAEEREIFRATYPSQEWGEASAED